MSWLTFAAIVAGALTLACVFVGFLILAGLADESEEQR